MVHLLGTITVVDECAFDALLFFYLDKYKLFGYIDDTF